VKALAAKLSLHRAVGLYLGEQELAVIQVAGTPLGPQVLFQGRQAYAPDELPEVLGRLLGPLLAGKPRPVVAVGLPASRVFYVTRSLRAAGEDASPEVLLQKAIQSPNLSVDDLTVELVKSALGKAPLATMAACRTKQLSALLAALKDCGVRPCCVEPGPCALVRAAAQGHRAPWRAKMVLRVFLGDQQGLGVMAGGDLPLAWRSFALPAEKEGPAILSAARTLRTLAKYCGITAPLDAVLIHGRPELHERLKSAEFSGEIGCRLFCHAGPGLDGAALAQGLARGALKAESGGFDLSRSLKPRLSIREIFPWGELALQGALLFCVGLLLLVRSVNLRESCLAAQVENQRHECLAAPQAALEKERQALRQKVEVVQKFLQTRVLWTDYTHDLPLRLPRQAQFRSLQGFAELESFAKRKESTAKPRKSFMLQVWAPLAGGGGMPQEIDRFLDALRNHPLLKRDFPQVTLADLKRYRLAGFAPTANFTVVCLPNAERAVAPPPPKRGGKEKP
jgi:hypothetical protein